MDEFFGLDINMPITTKPKSIIRPLLWKLAYKIGLATQFSTNKPHSGTAMQVRYKVIYPKNNSKHLREASSCIWLLQPKDRPSCESLSAPPPESSGNGMSCPQNVSLRAGMSVCNVPLILCCHSTVLRL